MDAVLAALVIHFVQIILAQQGTDCVEDTDCNAHQSCVFGYCHCHSGYWKGINFCHKIRKYGEDCEFDEQCNDFRLSCSAPPGQVIKRCLCASFYEYNVELVQCTPAENFTDVLRHMQEDTTLSDLINYRNRQVFYNVAVAGMLVIVIGLVLSILCVIYGCCCRNVVPLPPDEEKETSGKLREEIPTGSGEGTFVAMPTELSGQACILPIA